MYTEEEISSFPIAVIATSQEEGETYAKNFQLDNYQVFTEENASSLAGFRMRGIIVSPGYSYDQLIRMWENFERVNGPVTSSDGNSHRALEFAYQSHTMTRRGGLG